MFMFYAFGILVLIHELIWIISPRDKSEKSWKAMDIIKELGNNKLKDMSEEFQQRYKDMFYSVLLPLMYMFWWFLGIFTNQWPIFLGWIVCQLLLIPIYRWVLKTNTYVVIHWIFSVVSAAAICFLIINQYHLHIDLAKVLFNL